MTAERVFMFLLLWLTCFVVLPAQLATDPDIFAPKQPDAFMRLERVNTLVETGNWYDGHIARAAGAEGADIHWTRPMDLLILGVAAPLVPFMQTRQAIEIAGVALPALMSLILVFVCIWAVMPLMQPGNLFSIVILLAVQPIIQNYFGIGRVDHHMVLAVLTAAVLGYLIRLDKSGSNSRPALLAGILTGLGIWISLEFLVVYVPVTLGLGVCWLLWGTSWRRINRDFALGVGLACLAAVLVDVSPDNWLTARYDRISIAQLFLVSCPAVFWILVAKTSECGGTITARMVGAGLFAIVCLALIKFWYPGLFIGPEAEADPRIAAIWYDNVSEMLPLFTSIRKMILFCLLPFCGIVYGLFVLSGKRHQEQRHTWVLLSLVLVCTGALALAHMRTALYLSVAGVIAAGPLMEDVLNAVSARFSGWRKGATGLLVRAVIILGPFSLAVLVGAFANGLKPAAATTVTQAAETECTVRDIAGFLADDKFIQGRGVLRFANNLDYGPELIYRTRHHFLAVPYHRNGETILDTYDLMTAVEFSRSRDLLGKYGIDYILICPNASDETYFRKSAEASVLYNRLVNGDLPEELVPVEAAPKPWMLFEYRGNAM